MRARSILAISIILLVSPAVWPQAMGAATPGKKAPAAITQPKVEPAEIGQMPGFPILLEVPDSYIEEESGGVWNYFGVVLADLDGDGDQELIYSGQYCSPPGCDSGYIWAWDHMGVSLPGFPVSTGAGAFLAPSIGDLDGDGTQEIVQVTADDDWYASILAVDHLGAVVPGFPITVADPGHEHFGGRASLESIAALYDLDQDGALEIVYPSMTSLHVYEVDGTQWENGWPIRLSSHIAGSDGIWGSTPSIADMDGDGAPEVFVTGNIGMYLFETTAEPLDGWPVLLPTGSYGAQSAAAVADLDGDIDLEVVVPVNPAEDEGAPRLVDLYVYHHDGTVADGWPKRLGEEYFPRRQCPPLVTDLEGDGELEILIAVDKHWNESRGLPGSLIYAWDASGNPRPGFPVDTGIPVLRTTMLTAADVNGDGLVEVFADPGSLFDRESWESWDGFGYVLGIDAFGQVLPGFPLRPEGFATANGVIIGDVDADGDYELAVVGMMAGETRSSTTINLFDLEGAYLSSNRDWTTYHAVNQRGGVHKRAYRGWRVVHAGSRRGGGRK